MAARGSERCVSRGVAGASGEGLPPSTRMERSARGFEQGDEGAGGVGDGGAHAPFSVGGVEAVDGQGVGADAAHEVGAVGAVDAVTDIGDFWRCLSGGGPQAEGVVVEVESEQSCPVGPCGVVELPFEGASGVFEGLADDDLAGDAAQALGGEGVGYLGLECFRAVEQLGVDGGVGRGFYHDVAAKEGGVGCVACAAEGDLGGEAEVGAKELEGCGGGDRFHHRGGHEGFAGVVFGEDAAGVELYDVESYRGGFFAFDAEGVFCG